jgi:CheY-like chemotaxis protein
MATILIVDDLSANRKVLVRFLGDQGHRLHEAQMAARDWPPCRPTLLIW